MAIQKVPYPEPLCLEIQGGALSLTYSFDTCGSLQMLIFFFFQEYQPRLSCMCETEGRSLVAIHLYFDDSENYTTTVRQINYINVGKQNLEMLFQA